MLTLPVRTPFPWRELLAYLSIRATPEIEEVTPDSYRRRLPAGVVSVSFDRDASQLRIDIEGSADEAHVRERVSALFDTGFDASAMTAALARTRVIGARVRKVPGLRPLGAWDAFELCVRTILGQQVTVAAASTLMRRWVQRCGSITPESILSANLDNIGMPTRRVETIRTLARAVVEGRVKFDARWPETDAALKTLPGFGPWTRGYLAIRLGREPDAFPATDLGLIRAAQVASSTELVRIAERWRPFRGYAATYLWVVPDTK